MNDIFWVLRFLTFYSFVSVIRLAKVQYQPLIFHPKTLQYFVDWEMVPEKLTPLVVACPNFSNNEILFNEERSLGHKSLFVRNYINEKQDTITCEKPLELAAVIHSIPNKKFIKFGFEVYFNQSEFIQYFKKSNFGEFSAVTNPTTLKKSKSRYIMDTLKKTITPKSVRVSPYLKTIQRNKKIKQTLDFVWISKIVIQYDFDAWTALSISYPITQNPNDFNLKCVDDNFGSQFYNEGGVKKFYDNQGNVFQNSKLPNPKEHDCGPKHECVTKYNLLLPYQFQSSRSSPISCSDLTSIPVWHKNTEELLNYSEKFLIAIAKATGKTITITAGTHRELLLKRDDVLQEIFLDRKNNKFPVPKIVYKIVKYQLHNCEPFRDTCWFTMVIVIQNEPDDDPELRICTDKCKAWGWENIQYMTTTINDNIVKSKQIYCCEWDQKLRETLNYTNSFKTGHLDLTNFPYLETKNSGKIDFKNRKKEFEDKMRQLFGM